MKILLTNDDGIEAPGLWELQKSISDYSETVVVAPAFEQSGRGAGLTLSHKLVATRVDSRPCESWSVPGTPADCVKCALKILPSPPDLILSGINPGLNSGRYVFASGTVGSIIEGTLNGIPGIAFSCDCDETPQFQLFTSYIAPIVDTVVTSHPIPQGSFLNVNFPHPSYVKEHGIAGIKFTRHGKTFLHDTPDPDTEGHWIRRGYITIVPIYVGDLTHWSYLEKASDAFHALNENSALFSSAALPLRR